MRPEDVTLTGDADGTGALVRRVTTTGADRFAAVDAAGVEIVIRLPPGIRPLEGERLAVGPTPVRAHLFDRDGRRISTLGADA